MTQVLWLVKDYFAVYIDLLEITFQARPGGQQVDLSESMIILWKWF